MDLARKVLDMKPHDEHASKLLGELEKRFTRAGELYGALDPAANGGATLDEQLALLLEAVELFPDHPSGHLVQVRVGQKARQYRRALEQALATAREGDWPATQSWLEQARTLNHGAEEVERPLRLVAETRHVVQDARSRIDLAIQNGDEQRALMLARASDQYTQRIIAVLGERDAKIIL